MITISVIKYEDIEKNLKLKRNSPLYLTINILSKKWTVTILLFLQEPKRFNQLERMIPGISHSILSQQLKELEKFRLIKRFSYPEKILKVEYSLTDFGISLLEICDAIKKWGYNYASNVEFFRDTVDWNDDNT